MATSSITKNFVVSGEEVEDFADAIEEAYQDSLRREKTALNFGLTYLTEKDEVLKFLARCKAVYE